MSARRDLLGSTSNLMLADADAELIATCTAFCDLERTYDAPGYGQEIDSPEYEAVQAERERIVAEQEPLVDRMCELPCATLAGVQAMAKALAAWDRELLKDIPARDVGDRIASNMVERLLALRVPDRHPDAVQMCGAPPPNPDAAVLSLRDEFRAAVALWIEINHRTGEISDEEMDSAFYRLKDACSAIVDSPSAQTRAGRALKAAAAMHQLTAAFNEGCADDWSGIGEEMAWHVLSEIAGDEYVPSLPERSEPPRRKTQNTGRPGNSDADLVRVCLQFAEAELETWYRYTVSPEFGMPELNWDRVRWIATTPATTPEGWRAKALVYSALDREAYDDEPETRAERPTVAAGLLRDMVAPLRNAIIADLAAKYGPLPRGYTPEGIWLGAAVAYGEAADA